MKDSLQRKVCELLPVREFLATQLDELVVLAKSLLHEKSIVYLYQCREFYTGNNMEFFDGNQAELYSNIRKKVIKLRLLCELIRSSRSSWVFVSFRSCLDLSYELARACHAHIVTDTATQVGISSRFYLPLMGSLDEEYYLDDVIQSRIWMAPVDISLDLVEYIEIKEVEGFYADLEDFENWLIDRKVFKRRLGLIQRLESCLVENTHDLTSDEFLIDTLRTKLATILRRKKVSSSEILQFCSLLARYYCSTCFLAKRRTTLYLSPSKPVIRILLDHSWLNFDLIRYWLVNNYHLCFFSHDLQMLKSVLITMRKWLAKNNDLVSKWDSNISWSQWELKKPYLRFSAFDRLDLIGLRGLACVALLAAPHSDKPLATELLSGVAEDVWLPARVIEKETGLFATSDLLRLAMLDEIERLASYASTNMLSIFELLAKQGWLEMEKLDWWRQFAEHRLAMLDTKAHLGHLPLDADFWMHKSWKYTLKVHRESTKKYRHFQSAHWLSLHLFHFLVLLYVNLESRSLFDREFLLLNTFSPPDDWAGVQRFVSQWGLRRVEFYLLQYWPEFYEGGLSEALSNQS